MAGGLAAGEGKLAPGYDPNQKYKLLKWPQIEREFPKHFRIATAMMKGPQLLTEIAEGSTVPLTEVIDFVNANLASGPADLRQFPEAELPAIADELRAYLIESVGKSGGPFRRRPGRGRADRGPALSLRHPDDRIVWDVGHQCYPHKILTGRRDHPHGEAEGRRAPFPSARRASSTPSAWAIQLHLDLGRARHGDRRRAQGSERKRGRRDRRRRDDRGHGL
jgi:hypothetical protein